MILRIKLECFLFFGMRLDQLGLFWRRKREKNGYKILKWIKIPKVKEKKIVATLRDISKKKDFLVTLYIKTEKVKKKNFFCEVKN